MKITTEGPEFEMPSHYMKEVVASVKTKEESQPVKTKRMTKPKKKPVPNVTYQNLHVFPWVNFCKFLKLFI
jgi:hypothetical protein